MNNKEWQLEREHLKETLNVIDNQLAVLGSSITETKQFVGELRDYYVRGTQIFGDIDPYERVGINERIDNLIEIGNQNIDKTERLKHNRARPYFGRVRFDAGQDSDDFYIGLMGIEQNNKYYVYDWRAPICELFYDYGLGKASFKTPLGKIEGDITLKRQFDIQNGELIDMYDKDFNIFDEYLQKILSKISTDKLHNIASTIQSEQNKIIRDLRHDLVIVQGYAGSGKTTVALHRIAYALYRLKDLQSANILIFTLNEAFMSHIDGVLPELGEQNTRSATMAKFMGRLLKFPRHFEENDMFLTRYLTLSPEEQAVIAAKLDLSIKGKVQSFVDNLIQETSATKGFKLREIPFSPKLLNTLFKNNFGDLPYFDRFNEITKFVVKKTKVPDKVSIFAKIKEQVLECFNADINLESLYIKFCIEAGFPEPDLSVIKTEDAILLCVLKSKLSEMIVKMDIRHIVIDEAQEYPPLFLDFLLRLFPQAQFSIFGDKYQQTQPFGVGDLERILDLKAHFGESVVYTLDNTYRSSEEIVDYASKIIGNPRHNAFRLLNNEPVVECEIGNNLVKITEKIREILEDKIASGGTIGIITGDVDSAREIAKNLGEFKDKICVVDSAKSDAYNQVQVLPVSLSKGLEFNTVIVVQNGGLFDGVLGENLKYIACTRAINKLYVLR